MKKVIPFTKQIHFKTVIAEITDIEVTHDLQIRENNIIEGNIIVDGSYKMHEASQIEDSFHYDLPFTIEVDDKYDISSSNIIISDFYFEIINEEDLKVNVELEIGNVYEKELVREESEPIPYEIDEKIEKVEIDNIDNEEEPEEKLEPEVENIEKIILPQVEKQISEYNPKYDDKETTIENKQNKENSTTTNNYQSIFDTISNDETFVTYYVYIVREQDTLEYIIDKYKITKEDLSLYNDLDNIKPGTKIIIPCHNE